MLHMFQVAGFPIPTLTQGLEDANARAVSTLGDLRE